MIARTRRIHAATALGIVAAWASPAVSPGATPDDSALTESIERAALEYDRRLQSATQELAAVRERITTERLPLEESRREAEDQVVSLQHAVARAETDHAQAENRRKQLQAELDALSKNLAYLTSLARDAVQGLNDALLPAETGLMEEQLGPLHQQLQDPANLPNAALAQAAARLITARLERVVGGHAAEGSCMVGDDSELVSGSFAWLGPEVFFLSADHRVLGTVRARNGLGVPVAHVLPDADLAAAGPLFRGERGVVQLDPSGGKALRLREVRGDWIDHVKKGGVIGYVIIALGGLAVLTTLLKLSEVRHMKVDSPETIRRVLGVVERGALAELEKSIGSLCPASRELFETGLRHLGKPKSVLEDHLYAALLRQRMRVERRLPFLTVIVAAAPLLGLLGTVTGMIKTFTLINVFGTGNAAKLSSGISEALVTTELGLMVAIPTLVVHGFLNRRTQKNLAQMERYAAEFVAAAGERQVPADTEKETRHA